jgi:hypothetical protein
MPRKKDSRKAQSAEDNVREFIERVRQYEDFSSNLFDQIPKSFPRRLPLKFGSRVVGKAVIDWVAVSAQIFDTFAAMSKPADLSDDEYTQQLKSIPVEVVWEKMLLPIYMTVAHMLEFLPEKFNDAIKHLFLEGRHKMIIKNEQERGSDSIPSPAEFAEWVAKAEKEAAKKRLPEIRGGSDPELEISDEQCTKLAAEYPTLHTHWKEVRRGHKRGGNWREHAKVDQSDTPDDLLDKLNSLDPYDRQPATLAHEHAARRCGIPANTYSLRHLSRFRQRGHEILGQSNAKN